MKAIKCVLFSLIGILVGGCGLVPDKVSSGLGSLLHSSGPSYFRVDVFNNTKHGRHPTIMVLNDRGGEIGKRPLTGDFASVNQNTYFSVNGTGQVDDNTITARFYDGVTGEYLGLYHYTIGAGGVGYQAIHWNYDQVTVQ